jgi:large subunit ribosomal protein L28
MAFDRGVIRHILVDSLSAEAAAGREVIEMSRFCPYTGKRTVAGRSWTRRGKAKYLGGVGRKVTGIAKRKFKPNIQKVRALVDGKAVRIRVSAKAIRMGLIVKRPRRERPQPVEGAA